MSRRARAVGKRKMAKMRSTCGRIAHSSVSSHGARSKGAMRGRSRRQEFARAIDAGELIAYLGVAASQQQRSGRVGRLERRRIVERIG
ncbi:MAG TPA: hypothetical protein PKA55_06910 [Rhodoblastus sp.]|nr:hypothetical protein [Rhodoblastus sp.]